MNKDLIAFLKARLDEHERAARDVPADRDGPWWAAFVLADVAAKRRILDEVAPAVDELDGQLAEEWGGAPDGTAYDLVRLLALPYATHSDYREGWKP